jgi:hypothetical protein
MNTPSPAALRAANAWISTEDTGNSISVYELAALIDREFQSALITEFQVVSYLREKCAELQAKAGEVYVSLDLSARRVAGGGLYGDWRAYIEGGEARYSKTADEAIADAVAASRPDAKAARLRAEIAERQNELAKLEAGK